MQWGAQPPSLCQVGPPQQNGDKRRFFMRFGKQREEAGRLGSADKENLFNTRQQRQTRGAAVRCVSACVCV